MLEVHQFSCLQDNYGFLLHDSATGATASIDTPEVGPINQALAYKGWQLTHILNTHHHYDHVGGNFELKKRYNCKIVGFKEDKDRIPEIDVLVEDNQKWKGENFEAKIYHIPGHTSGHIAFHFFLEKIIFTGDTLFL